MMRTRAIPWRRASWPLLLAILLGLGLWVRWYGLPVEARHRFDGHELSYLHVFLGDPVDGWSTRLVPALAVPYQLLGALTRHPPVLLASSTLVGLVGLAALGALLRRQGGTTAAALGVLAVVLHGPHAFWSSAAYPVIHASTLCLVAWWLSSGGWLRCLGAGAATGLAIALRPEAGGVLIPLVLTLPAPRRHRLPWLVAGMVPGAIPALPLLSSGAHPPLLWESALPAMAANLSCIELLAPWGSLPRIAWVAILIPFARHAGGRVLAAWGAWGLAAWLAGIAFADLGYRHLLPVGMALAALGALGAAGLLRIAVRGSGSCRWAAGAALILWMAGQYGMLLEHTAEVAHAYYRGPQAFRAVALRLAPPVDDDSRFEGCRWVTGEPPLPGASLPSHLALVPGTECVLWGEEYLHRSWTSRALHPRSVRMHACYEMEPVAVRTWPEDPGRPVRLVWRIQDHALPPAGSPDPARGSGAPTGEGEALTPSSPPGAP